MTTFELIVRTVQGDQSATQALVEILRPIFEKEAAYAIVRVYGTGEDVKELTNEIFADLFADGARLLRRFDPQKGETPEEYFRHFARLRCTGFARDESDQLLESTMVLSELDELLVGEHPETVLLEELDAQSKLRRIAEVLSPLEYDLFTRRVLKGEETQVICAAMNLSSDALFQRIHHLWVKLQQHGFFEEQRRGHQASGRRLKYQKNVLNAGVPQSENALFRQATGQWSIVFDAKNIDSQLITKIISELIIVSKDRSLTMIRINFGSVILILNGTREGFEIIKKSYNSGKLTEICGNHIKDIRWLGDSEDLIDDVSPKKVNIERRLFYSYTATDERYRIQLEIHLAMLKREKLIDIWHFRRIAPGMEVNEQISNYIGMADIIILLISPDYIANDYCFDREMSQAINQHNEGRSKLVPLLIRPADYKRTPFSHLQCLPRDGRPITEWRNRDRAWVTVIDGIRQIIETFRPLVQPA